MLKLLWKPCRTWISMGGSCLWSWRIRTEATRSGTMERETSLRATARARAREESTKVRARGRSTEARARARAVAVLDLAKRFSRMSTSTPRLVSCRASSRGMATSWSSTSGRPPTAAPRAWAPRSMPARPRRGTPSSPWMVSRSMDDRCTWRWRIPRAAIPPARATTQRAPAREVSTKEVAKAHEIMEVAPISCFSKMCSSRPPTAT
mmetsp:Transcript_178515/g.572080  ORF Transcript_178515/g.572080 Transcript_178515/m.572080 type:complete len:207 (-) Transcript_178515:1002-1622(-)